MDNQNNRTSNLKQLKFYLIAWQDATDSANSWLSADEMTAITLSHNVSYSHGWLMGEENGYVVLAASGCAPEPTIEEVRDFGTLQSIPIGWILFMQEIPYRITRENLKVLKNRAKR